MIDRPDELATTLAGQADKQEALRDTLFGLKLWLQDRLQNGPIETRGQYEPYRGQCHPTGYSAVLVPDWEMKQRLADVEEALR
jgi:hypothetical protein